MTNRLLLIAALAVALSGAGAAGAQVSDASFVCFPTCSTTDGRMIGTSSAGFENFNDLEGVYPLTLKIRLRLPATVADGTPVTLGIFDPDGRGPSLGKVGGGTGYWDADFDGEIRLRYSLCTDANVDYECDGAPLFTLDSDTDLADKDNAWFTFTTTDLASATNPVTFNRFWVLEITQFDNPDLSWNMLKVAFSRPGSIAILPNVAFAFGVPITSCTDYAVLFNGQSICTSPSPDFSDTTYDGTWSLKTQLPRPADGSLTVPNLTMWDGDFDYGNRPRSEWKDPTARITPAVQACYLNDPTGEAAAAATLDGDDDNTNVDPATGFTEVPPQLLAFDPDEDGTNGDPDDMAAFGVNQESDTFAESSLEFGNCYGLGYPPENWSDDEEFGTAYFKRPVTGPGQISYAVTIDDPRTVGTDGTYPNNDPSGNREWEKFSLQFQDGSCGPSVADYCIANPIPVSSLISVDVFGMDILNISHMVFPVCVPSDGLPCLEETTGGPCSGKVTEVALEYLAEGSPNTVYIEVTAKNATAPVFAGTVTKGQIFQVLASANPTKHAGTLGTEITLRRWTNSSKTTLLGSENIHTSCSQAIGAGYRSPSCNFEVVRAYSKNNGLITAVLNPNQDDCPLNDTAPSTSDGGGGGKKSGQKAR